MTDRDPSVFGDAPLRDDDAGLELPLEMFFAEDRCDPRAIAASAALEAGVLDRVGAQRGFVSGRERKLIRACRGALLGGALCVLLGAAVADRLGVAPWNPAGDAIAGPVSGLVVSTSQETAGTIERAIDLRERLLRVVEVPEVSEPAAAVPVTLRGAASARAGRSEAGARWTGGPYLTAEGFGVAGMPSAGQRATVIRFEDGFSVPAMAGDTRSELRWPASRDVTASVVTFDGGASLQKPARLSPAWYADQRSDRSR